jgi:hypothetical protein
MFTNVHSDEGDRQGHEVDGAARLWRRRASVESVTLVNFKDYADLGLVDPEIIPHLSIHRGL